MCYFYVFQIDLYKNIYILYAKIFISKNTQNTKCMLCLYIFHSNIKFLIRQTIIGKNCCTHVVFLLYFILLVFAVHKKSFLWTFIQIFYFELYKTFYSFCLAFEFINKTDWINFRIIAIWLEFVWWICGGKFCWNLFCSFAQNWFFRLKTFF